MDPIAVNSTLVDSTQERVASQPIVQDRTALSPLKPAVSRLPDPVYDCLRQAVKCALHLHTKGSTPLALLMYDAVEREGVAVSTLQPGDLLEEQLSIDGRGDFVKDDESGELRKKGQSLSDYCKAYANLSSISKTVPGALITYYTLMNDLAGHHVRYVEFRTGLPEGEDALAFVDACQAGCNESMRMQLKRRRLIDYGLIALINRGGPDAVNRGLALVEKAISVRQQGRSVVGIDLAGNEAEHPVTHFKAVFDRVHEYNRSAPYERRLGITIHAGETVSSSDNTITLTGDRSVEKAIELGWRECTPLRIGHGIQILMNGAVKEAFEAYRQNPDCLKKSGYRRRLFEKAPILKSLLDKKIGIEVCPKSNFQTGAVKRYTEHPARFFYDLGLLVSVNPDNLVISKTDSTHEYVKLLQATVDIFCEVDERSLSHDRYQKQLPRFIAFMEGT